MLAVMAVLVILSLLAAVSVGAASQFSGSANRDTQRKRALEAADAGLVVATYRLNMLNLSKGGCDVSGSTGTNGSCGPYTQDLGNGSSFSYYVTPVLKNTANCAGLPIANSTVDQRCITSMGTVNGVVRRVQVRVAAYQGAPVFPVNGVIGLSSVTDDNGALLSGTEASNGQITLKNKAAASSTTLGPSAPPVIADGSSSPCSGYSSSNNCVVTRTAAVGPFVLSPVNPGNSATTNGNDDGRISSGADPATGPVSYTASSRTLSLGNAGTLTLGGGLYNFCSLSMGNNATISLLQGVRTVIFIDSPARPGSNCPAGSGTLTMGNGASFINQYQNPPGSPIQYDSTALQIYIYGWPGGYSGSANVVSFNVGSSFYGTIYAPQSTINVNNSAAMYGALAGNAVTFNNSGTFTADQNDLGIQSNTDGTFFRTAWHECLPQPTDAQDPQSGC
jgi:type II secretory pathway pseudopilin PulG